MITGTLVGDSLRPGAEFHPPGTRIRRVYRLDLDGRTTADQPRAWTVIDFETEDDQIDALTEALADVLDPAGGWNADFRQGEERVVVFPGSVFRFTRDDDAGRAAAQAHGYAAGGPEHQLDWAD